MPGETILIVEDNALIAMALEHILMRQGYATLASVDTGEAAITVADEKRPDLILMDVGLAGQIDGFRAAEEITALTGIPIIFMTGNTQDARLQSFRYLSKPVANQNLFQCIENTLHS